MSINDKISMFYNAKPIIFERAKAMRKNMTQAEKTVWELLKSKNMLGLRFKPQHPIDIFIADFYCHPLKLVIEVDGGIHKSVDQREYDIGREAELERWGIKVIRFTNEEIENDISHIQNEIERICLERRSDLQSPLQGI
jgi:very-short-patch-repair endonuclease